MTDADIEELKAAKESLMTNSQQVFAKMYEQAQQAAGGAQGAAGPDMGAAGQQTADNGGDDVVDGRFQRTVINLDRFRCYGSYSGAGRTVGYNEE